jgi:hypothetical protein
MILIAILWHSHISFQYTVKIVVIKHNKIIKKISHYLLTYVKAHAVIHSRGGIWTKSVVQRRARLTINQNNETNASISNSMSNSRHRSTKTVENK